MSIKKSQIAILSMLMVLVASLTGTFAGRATAAPLLPTIAILDTAIDTSLPAFQGKIIQEVCIVEWMTCPNGTSFMEGPGAASMPANQIKLNGFDHGTLMSSVFLASNPNANIVFIKIIGNTAAGARQSAGEATVYNALNWVKANASKYNIQAVSMSQGHHNLGAAGTDYCPKTPTTAQAIKDLMALQIPVFFPSGNGRDYARIDWPACLDDSISVGYVDQQNEISVSSNYDVAKLDFFAPGFFSIAGPGNIMKNISGSSAAIQLAAGQWLKLKSAKPTLTYSQLLDAFRSTAKSTIGRQGTITKLINFDGALSYSSSLLTTTATEPAVAKAILKAQADAAIAAAQAEYDAAVKAAADKLATIRAIWLSKIG